MLSPFAIAVLLAWVAGFVDAAGYLSLSQVFVAHMSGNTVAAAAHFTTGKWSDVSRRAFPIPMFVLGVFCGAIMARIIRGRRLRRSFAPSFILEALLLGLFAGLTHRWRIPGFVPAPGVYLFTALLALAMGLQSATLRHARDISVRTTFISGMLVNMAEKSAGYFLRRLDSAGRDSARTRHEGKQALKYGSLWGGMCLGAICGGWLTTVYGTAVLLFPIAALAAITLQDLIRPISESAAR